MTQCSFEYFLSETIGSNIASLVDNATLSFPVTESEYPDLQGVARLRWTDGSVSKPRQVNGKARFSGREDNHRIMKDLIISALLACGAQLGEGSGLFRIESAYICRDSASLAPGKVSCSLLILGRGEQVRARHEILLPLFETLEDNEL